MPDSVKIVVMGGDDHTVEFVEGKKVSEYLESEGITLEEGQTVSLNGETVDLDAVASPEVNIVVAGRSGNG